MNDVPEYLRRLRQAQAERTGKGEKSPAAAAGTTPSATPQEQDAIRWAKQLAGGQELRSIRSLAGARFAVLVRLQSATGARFISLEGLPSRDALRERVKPGATVGEEVLGAYEIKGGRPVTIAFEEGQVVLRMGNPRPGGGAAPISPEKMLRHAADQAEKRAKERGKGGGAGGGFRRRG